jgi:hypothetical protein
LTGKPAKDLKRSINEQRTIRHSTTPQPSNTPETLPARGRILPDGERRFNRKA